MNNTGLPPLAATELSKLSAIAAKATAGEWSWEDDPPTLYAGRSHATHGLNLLGRLDLDWNGKNNLSFIAAASPMVVQRMITELLFYRKCFNGETHIECCIACGGSGFIDGTAKDSGFWPERRVCEKCGGTGNPA